MMIGWTYLESSSFILFASNLEWLVTKNTRWNIFTIIFLFSFHKGITAKGESSCCLPKVLILGQKLVHGKPSNCVSNWWSGFPSNTNLRLPISRFMPMRFAIFMINICVYNLPFKVFMNRKYKGVEDLMCGNVGETNWFRRFLMWAWIWWGVQEITSILVNIIFLFKWRLDLNGGGKLTSEAKADWWDP